MKSLVVTVGDFLFQTCKRNGNEVPTLQAKPDVHTFAVAKAQKHT